MPMWGNALPWKKTAETPNLGSEDQTDDMRPGLGWTGVAHIQDFVRKGGLQDERPENRLLAPQLADPVLIGPVP